MLRAGLFTVTEVDISDHCHQTATLVPLKDYESGNNYEFEVKLPADTRNVHILKNMVVEIKNHVYDSNHFHICYEDTILCIFTRDFGVKYCIPDFTALYLQKDTDAVRSAIGPLMVDIDYTNWRGERRNRMVRPISIRYGSTKEHPEPQWFMLAWDMEKESYRTFSMKDIHTFQKPIR